MITTNFFYGFFGECRINISAMQIMSNEEKTKHKNFI